MECSCQAEVDNDGGPSFFSKEVRTARKKHKCHECDKTINPGEKYECVSGFWYGHPDRFKTCMDCVSLRDIFFTHGWVFTQIWEDFRETFRGDTIPESCIAELTPMARARVCEFIESQWKYVD